MEDLEVLQIQAIKERKRIPVLGTELSKTKEITSVESKAKKDCFENVETVMCTRYLLNGFRFVGVYMPKTHKALYLCWSVFINILVTVYFPLSFGVSLIIRSEEKLATGDLLTRIQALFGVVSCSVKLTLMSFLLPKLLSCEPILKKLDQRCHTQEEFNKIKDLIKTSNRSFVLILSCFLCYTTCNCLSAVLSQRLPYNIYIYLDARASNFNFSIAVLIEMVLIKMACIQQTLNDSYALIYISILRTHSDILMKRISKLNTNTQQSLQENFEELKMCIIDHKNLIELYKKVGAAISITVFVQFTTTAIMLSTTLINILLFATSFASIVASCLFFVSVLIEIFPVCYFAQSLINESNRLPDVIFHSNWVDQSHSYRKALVFFMQRAQCSFEFTAEKFFPITLSSFLSIAKFAFSLYTFVKKLNIKDKVA